MLSTGFSGDARDVSTHLRYHPGDNRGCGRCWVGVLGDGCPGIAIRTDVGEMRLSEN